ncbi:MAG TPA: nucleotidyltransferase domain-containing protein [bacterium]|nr:nucleotidyltransferase domain-containing protein [Candidatus Omnitrophota bacterium]HOJ61178.1 nucleotidyltransferase domain-containing protein [bacterium]HOL94594.1 nucleotidyltransferase domain-containing protein [bacterium]HPP01354.1 nucleotidyltransferase domain-containing protein [bacterium]HXK93312.1 nucleotidyltransferase domain-containing protein [bacterium]
MSVPSSSPSPRVLPPAVYELKKRLVERFGSHLVRFMVFGSYARGGHTPDSDIDVLVTLAGEVNPHTPLEIWDIALDLDLEFDVVFDVHVFSEHEIQNTLVGATPLIEAMLSEGIPI